MVCNYIPAANNHSDFILPWEHPVSKLYSFIFIHCLGQRQLNSSSQCFVIWDIMLILRVRHLRICLESKWLTWKQNNWKQLSESNLLPDMPRLVVQLLKSVFRHHHSNDQNVSNKLHIHEVLNSDDVALNSRVGVWPSTWAIDHWRELAWKNRPENFFQVGLSGVQWRRRERETYCDFPFIGLSARKNAQGTSVDSLSVSKAPPTVAQRNFFLYREIRTRAA